jgi:hypothetical protein
MNPMIKLINRIIISFLGVISIGCGGLVISNGLWGLQKSGEIVTDWALGTPWAYTLSSLRYEWGFLGFFFVGLGFWLIVGIGKWETK